MNGLIWNYYSDDPTKDFVERVTLLEETEVQPKVNSLNLAQSKTGQGCSVKETSKVSGGLPIVPISLN